MLALTATAELAALDLRTGKELWRAAPDGPLPRQEVRLTAPAAGDGRAVFETADGRLHAVDVATGKPLWRQDLGSDVTSSLLLTPRGLLAGLADGRIVRLSASTGEIEAALAVDGVPRGPLVQAGAALLLLLDREDVLAAVEESLGKALWRREQEGAWSTPRPVVWEESVLIGNEQGEIWGLSLADGAPRWRFHLGGVPRGIGAADGVLYVGTLAGRLYAYRPRVP